MPTTFDANYSSSNYNPNGFMKIDNDGAFLRVANDNTGLKSFLNKEGIVIQRDSSSSFLLKSSDYTVYFNYQDVSFPISTDLDNLVSTLTEWCTQPLADNMNVIDSMNRMRTSTSINVLTVSNTHDKAPFVIDEVTSGNGETSTFAPNAITMRMSASNGSYIVRQSKLYAQHVYGTNTSALVGGIITTDVTASNVRSRIGVFDDTVNITNPGSQSGGNGVFFQWDNSNGIAVGYRTSIGGSQVDVIVPQRDWNLDKLINSVHRDFTYHPTSNLTYVFDYNSTDQTSPVRCGVINHGAVTYAHQFMGSNIPGLFANPSLPTRWEVKHASDLGPTPSELTIVQGPAYVFTDVDSKKPFRVFSADNGTTFKTLNTVGSVPLFSIRLAPAFSRSKMHPKRLTIVNTFAGGVAKWTLVYNGTLTGQTWTTVDPASWVQYSNTETLAINGTQLSTGYIVSTGVTEIDISDKIDAISSNIAGITDTLTVVLTYVLGSVSVTGGLEWVETD